VEWPAARQITSGWLWYRCATPLRLRDGVEGVGSAVGLAEAREVVEVEHLELDGVFSVKPQHLLLRRDLLREREW